MSTPLYADENYLSKRTIIDRRVAVPRQKIVIIVLVIAHRPPPEIRRFKRRVVRPCPHRAIPRDFNRGYTPVRHLFKSFSKKGNSPPHYAVPYKLKILRCPRYPTTTYSALFLNRRKRVKPSITLRLVARTIRLGAATVMLQRSDAPGMRRFRTAQDTN